MKRAVSVAASAAIALLFSGMLFARPIPKTSFTLKNHKAVTSNMTSDQSFAKTADRADLTEVKLGKLAEEKGGTATVRDFGKRMVRDHTAANDKLQMVGSKEGITLPSQPSAAEQQTYDELSKLSGKAFDQAYARDMLKDHEHDVAAFKQEVSDGKNMQVKDWASQTLPTLEEHLKLARQMYNSVGGSGMNSTGSGSSQ
jgi:putative membrane protein